MRIVSRRHDWVNPDDAKLLLRSTTYAVRENSEPEIPKDFRLAVLLSLKMGWRIYSAYAFGASQTVQRTYLRASAVLSEIFLVLWMPLQSTLLWYLRPAGVT